MTVPAMYDGIDGLRRLSTIWDTALAQPSESEVILSFASCGFLGCEAVVCLGALARTLNRQGRQLMLNVDSMSGAVRTNLEQNGFALAMGADKTPWTGNSIQYKEHTGLLDKDEIVDNYLKRGWFVGAERKLTQGAAGKVTHLVGLKV